jgi:hypothetical protein
MTPVRKFRSVEEMESPIWRRPGDLDLYRAIAQVWAFGRRTAPRRFPPGVHRHRSIEELDRQVEEWSVADFETRRRSASPRSL